MFLIVDSGATGCKWDFVRDGMVVDHLVCGGINFAHQAGDLESLLAPEAYSSLVNALQRHPDVSAVHFYGAGLILGPKGELPASVQAADAFLRRFFPDARIGYASDLLAAARAVCGREPGIAGILGTGSNSCLYDGERIVRNVHSSGYILGDEGGGVALGRNFMADFLKELVPEDLAAEFGKAFPVDYGTVVREVYRGERPAAYLGSFAPWIMERYERSEYVRALADANFRSFIDRCLSQYDYRKYPVGIVGGFGKAYEPIFRRIAGEYGIRISGIYDSPLEGLKRYHGEDGV